MEITGAVGGLALLIPLAILALVIWAIVDVAKRPSNVLSSGAKTAWIIGLVVGTLLFGVVGVVLALVYLIGIRPRLARSG
jgi:uncharacterized membrane protein